MFRALVSAAVLSVTLCAEAQEQSAEAQSGQAQSGDSDVNPMGNSSLGVKVGYIHYGATTFGGFFGVPARDEVQIGLPFNFGGRGIGFDLEPSIMFPDYTTISVYFGLALNIGIGRFYLGTGFGPKIGFMIQDGIDFGTDIYFRVPVRAHYYILDDLGLFFEFAFNVGGSGIKPGGIDIEFGGTTGFELSGGIRYP